MKKIIISFLIFSFLFSSVCYAEDDKISERSERSLIGEDYDLTIRYERTRVNPYFERSYDFWNKVFSTGRGYFCAVGDYYRNLLDWWKNKKNKSTDDEVYQYFEENTTINNNTYNFSTELSNDLNDYADYFKSTFDQTITIPCYDMFGKNFRSNGAGVDSSLLEVVFDRYSTDYDIFLLINNGNYSNNYYFNLPYSNILNCIRLSPKNDIYYLNGQYTSNGYTYNVFTQYANVGSYAFYGYKLDDNLNLVSQTVGGSSSRDQGLFGVKLTAGVSYGDSFKGNGSMTLPICYKQVKTLNVANSRSITSSSGTIYNIPTTVTNSVGTGVLNSLPNASQIGEYSTYRDIISGQNTTNSEIYNYITNIYPNGNDYQNEPVVNDKPGGLLNSLSDSLGKLGTAIGAIIAAIINGLINILAGIVSAFTSVLSLFTTLLPDTFKSFMQVFYGLVPEPIMNGIIALFSLMCIMAVVRIIRK